MQFHRSDLWAWRGTTGRGEYVVWAFGLVAVKYHLDRLVVWLGSGERWSLWDYFPMIMPPSPRALMDHGWMTTVLLLIALPFLWAGLVLTVRRLRDADLPLWLVIFVVVPLAKWGLFALLVCMPPREPADCAATGERRERCWLDRLVPRSRWGAAVAGLMAATLLALSGVWLSANVLRNYGFGLFVAVPFLMGFTAAVVHAHHQPRRLADCLLVGMAALALAAVALLALALEGIVCLLMAAPIAALLSVTGGLVGYAIQAARWRRSSPAFFHSAVLALPLLIGADHLERADAPLLEVKTAVVVQAPPEAVWRHVVSFAELPPPTEWLFRVGIAYPICARIDGEGVGAVRHCVFSTGPFVEPIEIWDEPVLLRFSVTENPAPMEEWTPYRAVHPPHLDGFLASSGGQFHLTPLPGGRTRLEGTTWYRHHLWPVQYWQLWSDFIIHRIHLRVLRHVKALAEQETETRSSQASSS